MSRWIAAGHALLDSAKANERGSGIVGAVGDALFACAFGDLEPAATHGWVQRAIDDLETSGGVASLHGGFAGLGLVVAMHRTDAEELLADLDLVLAEQLASMPAASLQSGVAGVGLYASLRSEAPSGRELQRAVVDVLREASVEDAGGRIWTTPPSYAKRRGIDVLGEPVIEYGVLHGIGGTLVALSALVAQGNAEAAELLRDGVAAAWTHAREGENRFGRVSFGPRGALGTCEFDEPRWCVGDAGVLRALWISARALGDASAADRALAAMRADAARDAGDAIDRLAGRIDLCCGAAAVAQVYLRMHRETGEAIFRDANRALLARCAAGIDRHEDVSFAYGKRGVLLALLAGEREDDPAWDGMLGMSLPRAASFRAT